MITHEEVIAFFKSQLLDEPEEGAASYIAWDLAQNIGFYSESNINAKEAITFAFRFLSSTTNVGILRIPATLLIDTEQQYADEIYNDLTAFALDYNETINETTQGTKIKTFYNTPQYLGANQIGARSIVTLSLDMTFIVFNDALTSKDVKITYNGLEIPYVTDYAYSVVKGQDSLVLGAGETKLINYTAQTQKVLVINFILSATDEVHKEILASAEETKTTNQDGIAIQEGIEIIFNDGVIERNLNVHVQQLTETIVLQDVTQISVTFSETGEI
jgi:hypothetical protein